MTRNVKHWQRRLSGKTENGSKKTTGKKGKPVDALNKLLKYLLPIAGRRILLLLGLAIVRTAFSNRLARMQVRLQLRSRPEAG